MKIAVGVVVGLVLGLEVAMLSASHRPRLYFSNTCRAESWSWDRSLSSFHNGVLEFRDTQGHSATIEFSNKQDAEDLLKAVQDWNGSPL